MLSTVADGPGGYNMLRDLHNYCLYHKKAKFVYVFSFYLFIQNISVLNKLTSS